MLTIIKNKTGSYTVYNYTPFPIQFKNLYELKQFLTLVLR